MPERDGRRCPLRDVVHGLTALAFGYSLLIAGGTPAGAQQVVPAPAESASTDEYTVKLTALPEYSEGKYGTGHTTQILEVPFRVDWSATDRLDLSLTIPYVWLRGRGDIPGQVTTADGLGDILAELDYTLLEEQDLVPDLTPFVEIKFPTADASRGLGTGEFDEKIGAYVTKKVGERWTTHVDVSYTFVGSPPRTSLRNFFEWSVGLSFDATSLFRLSGYVDGATAVSKGEQNPLDLRLVGEYKLTKHIQLTAGASAGLSHSSPDFSVLAGIELRY
jgi:Putative MetA-pathway of phenol degradation